MRLPRLSLLTACTLFIPLAAGCEEPVEPEIRDIADADRSASAYEDDGETANDAADPQASAGTQAAEDVAMTPWSGDGIAWQTPEPWTTQPGSGFRFATIANEQDEQTLEIAVTRFPGDVGGVQANVNRWAGQVGHPPVDSEAQLEELLEPTQVAGQNALLADITGDEMRIAALILPEPGQDRTWFFRILGEDEQVQATLPTLERILPTVEFADDAAE